MRKRFEQQMSLGATPISEVQVDLKSRDAFPKLLAGLIYIFETPGLNESVFKAATINTPSMLCVEDALDGLNWAIRIGGLKSLIARSEENLTEIAQWVENSNNVEFLAEDFQTQSCTSVCLNITCDWFVRLSKEKKEDAAKKVVVLLDKENIAYDIGSYRDAPPGLRIWCGGTIEVDDVKALTPWIEWAISEISIEYTV